MSEYNIDKSIKERDEMVAVLLTALTTDYENTKILLENLRLEDFQTMIGRINAFPVEELIFKTILELEKANRPISTLSVMASMGENEKEKACAIFHKGHAEYEKLKANNVSLTSVVDNWQELRRRIKLRYVLSQAQTSVECGSKDLSKIVEEVHNEIDSVGRTQQVPTVNQHDLNLATFLRLVNAPEPRYRTGFNEIDRRIGGFVQKRTYAVCARTGQGKSAMLLNMVANLGRENVPVGFISLEMCKEDMNDRLWCIVGQMESEELHSYPLSDDLQKRCRQIHHLTQAWPIYWSDSRGMTLTEVKSKMSQFARQGCKVVFIDFIQRIVVESKEPYHLQVALIAKTLSDLADKLNIAVVIATQANREGAKNANGQLELHNIADSTAIEQSCDVVILMNRKSSQDVSQGLNCPMRVQIAKNRHGATGFFDMYFRGREFRFSCTPFGPLPPQRQEPAASSGPCTIPSPVPIPEVRLMEERKHAVDVSCANLN